MSGLNRANDDLDRLRSLRGRTSALWAGGAVSVEAGRWSALTGASSADYNLVVCHGSSGGEAFPRAIEEIAAIGAPGMVMAAGAALAEVQQLVRASWVCVGSLPFMHLDLSKLGTDVAADDGVRRLQHGEVHQARALLTDVYGMGDDLARIALPDAAANTPGMSVWAAWAPDGTMVSCWATCVVEDVVGGWSLTTARGHQRQGHSRRVVETALRAAREDGARRYIGNSTGAALPLFTSIGFSVMEHWQVWSRPRWALGRF